MIRLVPLLVLLSCMNAQARLGETVAECEARYGPVVEHRAATQKESDKDACVFSKSSVTIVAEFNGGKAWKITYSKTGMDADVLDALLAGDAADGGWSAPLKISTQEFRVSSDHERLAIFTPGKRSEATFTLVVATKAFASANRADYEAKLAKVPAELQRRDDNRKANKF